MRSDTYRYPCSRWTRPRVLGVVGALFLAPALVGAVLAWSHALPFDPAGFVTVPHASVSSEHWLGADALGRDVASRLASASARFLGPGLLAVGVALVVGAILGLAEGLAGALGRAGARWATQVVDSVPKLVVVLLVASITRSHLGWIMASVGATFAPQVAGVVKSSIERLRSRAFIEAERCLGVGTARIIFVHILWGHARELLLQQVVSLLAYAVLVESSLSYLGGELGVQEPAASWGNMLAMGRDGLFRGHWLPAVAAAGMISMTLFGCFLVGDAMAAGLEDVR